MGFFDNVKSGKLFNEGTALSKKGKRSEAIALFDESLKLNPKNAWAWNSKGVALNVLGKHEEAIRCYNEAIKIGGLQKDLYWRNKAFSLKSLGRIDEADRATNHGISQWYDDDTKLAHIAVYDDAAKATVEANMAARKGWIPTGTSTTAGQISAGGIIAGDMLFGELGALAMSGRDKDKLTITYTRTPEWLKANGKN